MKPSSTKKSNKAPRTKVALAPDEAEGDNGILSRAAEIDMALGELEAAAAFVKGEFVSPPSRPFEIIERAIDCIRSETMSLRIQGLGFQTRGSFVTTKEAKEIAAAGAVRQ